MNRHQRRHAKKTKVDLKIPYVEKREPPKPRNHVAFLLTPAYPINYAYHWIVAYPEVIMAMAFHYIWKGVRRMTVPLERTWSIKKTRNFLRSLLDRSKTPRVPLEIRKQAASCLRHFPSDFYIQEVAEVAPKVFGREALDPIETDLPPTS